MYNLIQQLKNESSTNKKLEILQSYSGNGFVKEALKLTYDPFTRFYINKIGKRKTKDIIYKDFNEAFMAFKNIAESLSARKVTGNEAVNMVHVFLDSCSDELRDAFTLILKKDLKVGISVKSLNKAFGDNFIEDFNVQLSNRYDRNKKYKTDFWMASPKLDGLRCYFTHGKLLTRNGHEILGFDHIIYELELMSKYNNLDFVDGELYTNEIDFQDIQSAVMTNKNIDPEQKSKIKYHVFVVGRKDFKRTYDMRKVFDMIFYENTFEYLVEVPYYKIDNTPEMIDRFCKKFMEEGYEGVMLRSPDVWYEWKRSDALLKHKLFKEADFEIVGFYEGQDKYQGMLGGFVISGEWYDEENDVTYRIKSEVGTGFKDSHRKDFWNERNDFIGKIVEIKFQGITDKPDSNGVYSLRFPSFLKTKEDR